MMSKPTHILIVEDLESDFELAQLEIRKAVKECVFEQVDTRPGFLKALETFQPDVILSDYNLPRFDGMSALKLTQEQAPRTPFIIWTGSMSEDVAVECMKAGANNYILKENIKRLGPAVIHAVEERQLLLERQEAEDKLRQSISNYRALTENSVQGIAIFQNSRIVYANPAICTIMGYAAEELMGMSEGQILDLTHPDDRIVSRERTKKRRAGESVSTFNDVRVLRRDGTIRWIQTFSNPIEYDGQPAVLSTSIDITERKQAEEKYQDIFEHSQEGIFQSTPAGRFIKVNPAMARIYGYDSPQEMIDSITSIAAQLYIEPEDRNEFIRNLQSNDYVEKFEMRNFRKDKSIIWTHTSARTVRDASGNVLYYEGFLQDITERKQAEQNLRESEERFRSLIENSLDNISLLAADGTLLWENPAVNRTLGYEQDEFVNRNIFELMHPDDMGWTSELFAKLTGEPGSQQRGVFRLKHQNGTWRWIEATATNMLNEPSVKAIVINYRDVTEHKVGEMELQNARELFQKTFHLSPVATALSNVSDRSIVDINAAMEELFGYTRSEMMGRPTMGFNYWVNDEERQRMYAALLQQGHVTNYEFSFRNKVGEAGRAILSSEIIEQQEEKYILTTFIDITERKHAEIEIQQQNDDLQLINAINEAAIYGVSLDGIVNLLARELKRIFSSTGSALYMLSPDGKFLTMQQYVLPPEITRRIEKVIGSTIPLIQIPLHNNSFFQKALNSQHGSITSDREEIQQWMAEFIDTPFLSSAAKKIIRKLIPQIYDVLNIRSTILIPLLLNGKAIGLLDVSSANLFTEQDLKRIENISGQLTAAIQRQQADERVRRSEEFLQSVQNALSASIAILNEEGVVVQVNSAWRKFGEQNGLQHPEYCIGLNYLKICDSATGENAEEARLVAKAIRDVIAGQKREIQIEYPCHSPEEKRWFTLRITKFDDGDHIWVVMAHENITERKQFENALQVSEARYRLISENSTDVIWTLDLATQRFTYISPSVMHLRGLTSQEVMAEPLQAALTPDSYQFVVTNLPTRIQSFMAGDESALSYVTEIDQTRKDGSIVPTEVVTTLLTDANGVPVEILGVTRDITERKQAENLLKETNERFRTLFEASPEGIVLIGPQGDWRILDCNETACTMNGYTRDELVGQSIDLLTLVPDDSKGKLEYLERIREAGILRYDDYHRRKDGTVFPIAVSTSLITLGGREVILSIDRDITERKKAEQALLESEKRYRALFEDMPIAVWEDDLSEIKKYLDSLKEQGITDLQNYFESHPKELLHTRQLVNILDVNKAALEMYGAATKEELIQSTMNDMGPGEFEHWVNDLEAIATGKANNGWEGGDLMMDDTPIEISLNWTVLPGHEHDYSKVIFTTVDITERKRTEDELKRSHSLLYTALESTADGILVVTPDGKISNFNRKFLELWRIPQSLVAQKDDRLLLKYVLDQLRNPSEFITKVEALYQSPHEVSFDEINFLDGRVFERYSQPQKLGDTILGRVWSFRDITERKKMETAEREQRTLAEALRDTAETLNSTLEYGEVLDHILAAVGRVVPHDAGTIMLIDGEFALVVRSHGYEKRGTNDEIMGIKLPLAKTDNLRQILETGQPIVVYDTHAYMGWKRLPVTDWLRSNVGAPISIHGEVIGFILLDSKTPEFFTPVHAERLKAFANQAALAIQNARLLKQAQDEITERKQAEKELREEQEKAQKYLDIAGVMMLALDQDGNISLINQRGCEILGYSNDEILGRNWINTFIPESIRDEMQGVHQKLMHGDVESLLYYENPVLTRNGEQRMIAWHNTLVRDEEGRVITSLSSGEDITERKRAENELRASEERFRQLADNIQEIFWMTDAITGEEIYISPAAEKIWGRSIDSMLHGQDAFIESVLPEDRPLVLEKIREQRNGLKTEMEYRISQPDGSIHWIWDRAFPIFDENGMVNKVAGITADVTERKQAEMALLQSQARYHDLFDSSPISLWEEDYSLVKKRIENLQQSGVTNLDEYFSAHPDVVLELASLVQVVDVNRVSLQLYQAKRKEDLLKGLTEFASAKTLQQFRKEITDLIRTSRFEWEGNDQTLDGRELTVMVNGSIPPGYEDDWSKVIVSISDITEREQAERESMRHLAELEALYENGLAVGRLLNPREIGERIIATFARYLSWHHVTIRLIQPESNNLEMIAYSLPGLSEEEKIIVEQHFQSTISKVGQGLSGWVAQTGEALRTNDVHAHAQYVDTYVGIQCGLYMPLKIGDKILGVISVESERPDAFSPQDERLLATLASQAAIAFENARLYQTNQQERERFSELFENTPVATWLEDFSAVVSWMDGLRKQGITDLKGYLQSNPEAYRLGISLIDIVDVNHAAVVMNGARDKTELMEKVHGLMMDETPSQVMIDEMELIWRGYTSFGFEMSNQKLDGSTITGIQRIYIPVTNNEPDYARVIITNTDITDRVDVEKQLRASEVHYRELADSITDIFFELDHDLHYSHWNKASELLTGLSAEYAIGKSMNDVFGESDEQARIGTIYKDVLDTHQSRTFETTIPLNNQSRTFEINAYPSTRGVAVVAKDVTERKRSEFLMQKRFELMEYSAEHNLQELVQKALDEISEWTHSAIGFFQFIKEDQITPSMQVWSTDTFQHFHSSEVEEMHKPADQAGVWAEAVRKRRAVIHNNYRSMSEKKGLPESHAPLIREMIVPIIRNERIVAVIGIGNKPQDYTRDDLEIMERFADYAWDVTERKQMVLEIAEERNQLAKRVEERTSDLSRANSNLARALRVKDEFLANMSHELRTPLNAILGLSESLGEQTAGPLNEKQQRYLTTISESGHHLLSLINDILDLAKIEAGQITLDINKVDVNSISQASLRMIKQLAQKKNLDVSVEIDEKVGLMWADERRLKQMMVNLLSNAVKFTPEGGKVGLQINGDQEDNKVAITVWDTGIGIRTNDFDRLFQPFVQLDSGLARESSGTGLGLALVAQMARLHGGSINVQSDAGKGSRFTIILPWEPAPAIDTVERMKITGKFRPIRPGQTEQTILLIEDTQEVVMMIKDYLEMAGYKVATAQDGLDGITQAKFFHPDLILMDVQMPRMDGLEATKRLRQETEFKYTPIIALTALAMPNDRERCLAAGMDDYLSKPVNLRGLVKLIQSYLSIREEKTQPR
jgi:PAS domain S-box-containing protein